MRLPAPGSKGNVQVIGQPAGSTGTFEIIFNNGLAGVNVPLLGTATSGRRDGQRPTQSIGTGDTVDTLTITGGTTGSADL